MYTESIFDHLKNAGFDLNAICAIMGNMQAESNCVPNNVENRMHINFGWTDTEYTNYVDSGEYANFITDKYGYGLCQWTYHTRKKRLFEISEEKGTSISDIAVQIALLLEELQYDFPKVYSVLKNPNLTISYKTEYFMRHFENPANQTAGAILKRVEFAEKFKKEFSNCNPVENFLMFNGKKYILQEV